MPGVREGPPCTCTGRGRDRAALDSGGVAGQTEPAVRSAILLRLPSCLGPSSGSGIPRSHCHGCVLGQGPPAGGHEAAGRVGRLLLALTLLLSLLKCELKHFQVTRKMTCCHRAPHPGSGVRERGQDSEHTQHLWVCGWLLSFADINSVFITNRRNRSHFVPPEK